MKNIHKILEDVFHKEGWEITKPEDGWEEGSYIATHGDEKYFLKFGIDPQVMTRLAELSVTPHVITTGQIDGRDYMVQEFIKSSYVPREWLNDNLQTLADFFHTYHDDEKLLRIVKATVPEHHLSIDGEIDHFFEQLDALSGSNKYEEVRQGITELKRRYHKLPVIPLVPVHDDPNTNNIFLTDKGLQMIDWNKVRLSDPLSDIGAVLWWYVTPGKWEGFFTYYGMKMNDEVRERICLAAAKMTMGYIVWSIEHQHDYSLGWSDFTEAIQKRGNPRAWFNNKV